MKKFKQIIGITIENEAGALARVVDMFSARGYNIDSLNVGEIDGSTHLSRMVISLDETAKKVERIIRQIERIVPIVKVENVGDANNISRELALVSCNQNDKWLDGIMQKYSPTIICKNECNKKVVLQVITTPNIMDNLIKDLIFEGCSDIVRTGVLAISINN